MKIVADTSLLIDFLRAKEPEKSPFFKLNYENYVIIALVTVAELFSGKSAQIASGKNKLNNLFKGLEIRIPDVETAFLAGKLRYRHQLSIEDSFIAALAIKMNLPLAAFDLKAFQRVKNLKLFSLHGL